MTSRSPSPAISGVHENNSNHHGSGRSWTEEQISLLQGNQQEYRDASDAVRAQILGRVLHNMLAILPNGSSFNKEERAVVKGDVKAWFSRYSRRRTQKMPRMGQQWHSRRVFRHQHKEAIDAEAKKLCAEAKSAGDRRPKGGEKTHFDFRERVITEMMKELSKRDREDLERIAEEYNKNGVDPALKPKLAVKNCTAKIHAFSKELYDSMGARVFVFSCFKKPDGSLEISTYDFNEELGNGKDYATLNGRSFREHGISLASWQAHNEEYYELGQGATSAEGGHQGSRSSIALEKNSYGEPLLPDPSKPPCRTARDIRIWQEHLLRSFINQHYNLVAGQEKGSAPWTAIGGNILEYVEEEYLPPSWRFEGPNGDLHYKFIDPSKLSLELATKALKFWFERQEEGDITFRFKAYLEGGVVRSAPPRKKITQLKKIGPKDGNGKRKHHLVTPDSDSEEEDGPQSPPKKRKGKKRARLMDTGSQKGRSPSFWKANLGDPSYTDLRKVDSDEEEQKKEGSDSPPLEYKVGPRNARPGKVKHKLPFASVIREPVRRAQEIFPPQKRKQVEVFITTPFTGGEMPRSGGPIKPIDKAAEHGDTKPINAMGIISQPNDIKPNQKPRPKPRPTKVATCEMGIVTRDRSKKIAKDSMHATRSKKL